MSRRKWVIPKIDKKRVLALSEQTDMDCVATTLLISRGMDTISAIRDFCSDEFKLCDPFDLTDMDKAVEAIGIAVNRGEKITVFGDYDADGVTSTAIMFSFLEMQGADVDYYIPDRNTEGYGMNEQAIRKIAKTGTKLIVTVDNGISAIHEAEIIYELGMKLVITDHHKVPEEVPKAEAIVDPHRADNHSSFKEWSGAGVAFKTICALSEPDEALVLLEEFADLVAIGTIADVVALTGENRTIVKYGINKINQSERIGIEALKQTAGIDNKEINAVTVAFSIVPRINAIGRMENAKKAVELLLCDGEATARELSQRLHDCNMSRQKTENEIMEEAMLQLQENPERIFDRVLVFSGKNWHSGVIGIVASRFVDKYGKPCIVITGDGVEAKGSGRSIEGFSLYDCINSASYMLTHFGGHLLAAGFGLHYEDIDKFRMTVNDYAKTVKMPYPVLSMDFRLKPESISAEILDVFSLLEPFGAGNPQPLFGLYNLKIENITPVGGGKHLRLTLSTGNVTLTAMKFSTTPDEFYYEKGDIVDIAVRLEKNEYMGETRLSIYIKDIKDAVTDDEKCIDCHRLFDKIMASEPLSHEDKRIALPERDDLANVYRYIRQKNIVPYDLEMLCYRLGDNGEKLCRYAVSIEAMRELGLINISEKEISITDKKEKVDLNTSQIMKRLQ